MNKKRMLVIFVLCIFVFTVMLQGFVFAGKPVKTRVNLDIPTGLTAAVTENTVSLSWNTVAKPTGYYVYKATPNDSGYVKAATVNTNSIQVTGLTAGTSYWFYVQAYNGRNVSEQSVHLNVSTKQAVVVPTPGTSMEVLGFATYYYTGDKSSYNSMVTNKASLDSVATHTYITDASGTLTGLVPTEQINYANSNNITALAMISNNFDGAIAKAVLESQTNRQNLINNTMKEMETYGYKGAAVDLEGVYYTNRTQLTTFIQELNVALDAKGYLLYVAVPAKTSDSATNTWSGAYDYAELGKAADKVVLMTYDEHYPGGTPGPVASINWVNNVANYAVSVIPKEKLILGLAAYGYDWSTLGTKAYGVNGIYNLVAANNAEIKWDATSQSPYFQYTDGSGVLHTVWFENAKSISYKLDIVNNKALGGVGIWRLGLENADYWNEINTKLNQ